ncbi:hypothetical protein J6590_002838 [Homalodisca vitripennis]|nr:hypothetical protein J6590_002838 [Homalodisca vitripennis]
MNTVSRDDLYIQVVKAVSPYAVDGITHLANESFYLCKRLRFRVRSPTRHDKQHYFRKVRLEVRRSSLSYFSPTIYNEWPPRKSNDSL